MIRDNDRSLLGVASMPLNRPFFEQLRPRLVLSASQAGSVLLDSESDHLAVIGSAQDDCIDVVFDDSSVHVTLNGRSTSYKLSTVVSIGINGAAGSDEINVIAGADDDRLLILGDRFVLSGSGLQVETKGNEEIVRVVGGSGNDTVEILDTSGDDFVYMHPEFAAFENSLGQVFKTSGFSRTEAHAVNGGFDRARFYDSASDDWFAGKQNFSFMESEHYTNYAAHFERVDAYSRRGGSDEARLHGSDGDDLMVSSPDLVSLTVGGTVLVSHDYTRTRAYAYDGNDRAELNGDDIAGSTNHLVWEPDSAFLHTVHGGLRVEGSPASTRTSFAVGFDRVVARSFGGRAEIHGSAVRDRFVAFPNHAKMVAGSTLGDEFSSIEAIDFVMIRAFGNGGNDNAWLYDSTGDDRYVSNNEFAYLHGEYRDGFVTRSYVNYVSGFDIHAMSENGGDDQAWLNDLDGRPAMLAPGADSIDVNILLTVFEQTGSLQLNDLLDPMATTEVTRAVFSDVRRERLGRFSLSDFYQQTTQDLNRLITDCTPEDCQQFVDDFLRMQLGDDDAWSDVSDSWRRFPWEYDTIIDGEILPHRQLRSAPGIT